MKKKYKFWVETTYVNSNITEEIELIFEDNLSENEIDNKVYEYWSDWRDEKCNGGWREI